VDDQKKYKSNYRRLFTGVTFDHTANSLAGSALIVGYALFLGLSEFAVGLFLSLRVVLMFTAVFSAPLFSRIGQSKLAVLTTASLYRLSAFAIILIPFMTDDVTLRAVIFCVCISLSTVFAHLNYAPMVNWRMQLLKPDDQKRFFAQKNFVVLLISAVLNLTLSHFLDQNIGTDFAYTMFAIILSTIVLVAVLEITFRSITHKPQATDKSSITIKETITAPMKNRETRKVIILQVMFHFFMNLGTMYLAFYQIQYLEMSYLFIAILLLISTIAGMLGGFFFGKTAIKKRNFNLVLYISISMLMLVFIAYGAMGNYVLYVVPVLSFLWGFGATGFGLYEGIVLHETAPKEYKITALSCYKFYSGLVSLLLVAVTLLLLGGNNAVIIRAIFGASAVGMGLTLLYCRFAFKGKHNHTSER